MMQNKKASNIPKQLNTTTKAADEMIVKPLLSSLNVRIVNLA